MFELLMLLLGVWLGRTLERISAALAERQDTEEPEPELHSTVCRVEWHGDQCYVYREDTGEFLGQGTSIDQAALHIEQRGIEGTFVIPKQMAEKPMTIQP